VTVSASEAMAFAICRFYKFLFIYF